MDPYSRLEGLLMKRSSTAAVRNPLLLCLVCLGLVAALVFLPTQFRSEAGGNSNNGLVQQTKSHDEGLENYDIRLDKTAYGKIVGFRQTVNKDAAVVAKIRADFVRGEEQLRTRIPTVKVEYNSDIRTPEVITPDVWQATIEWLTPASSAKRSEILRSFVKENNSLIGVSDMQADRLRVTADYANPDGNLSYAHLEQKINDIPVFRGEVKAGFTKDGRIIRVINNLAPGLDCESLSTDFLDPADAVRSATGYINHELKSTELTRSDFASTDLKSVFGKGEWATSAEKMYFPTEPGVAVPAWRVLIWQPVNAYYVIVDAASGTLLWRKNITEDQSQTATYQVYDNVNSHVGVADSPAPLTPGPLDPTLGTQGPIGTRTNVTLIGNEAPNTFNNNGWITDGTNITDGNANEAGIDRDGIQGVDAPQIGIPNRVFDSTWNPPPGNPPPGDDPLTAQAQRGAVIQMFYIVNRYHDELYKRGFTEQAGNFQHLNFGRGGVEGDRISAEAQDSSGTNGANFSTGGDGVRGRLQMFIWTGPTPDRDGAADADIVIHEVTHGTSNRLHGNTVGLSTNMSRGMGEGWSDWYAPTLLAEPSDPINGIYAIGGYISYLILPGYTANYYYGFRRFPLAPISFLGPNGKPHNPLTFRHINADCNTLIGTTTSNPPPNSAYPRGPLGGTTCDQIHNIGEIWSSMLWEVRNRMVMRLGFTAGTRRALQVVTDGMKLAPLGPTILQERDAIIAAAAALPFAPDAAADVLDVRDGFRVRGAGFSASIQNAGTGANNTVVTEAFDFANVALANPFSVSDSTGNNNGFPEPGENVLLSVAVINATGATVNAVMANVNGGPNVSYGNIANGTTVVMNIPYTIPAGAACGSSHTVTINVSSAIGPQSPQMRSFTLGVPVGGFSQNFDGVVAPALPAGWVTNNTGAGPPELWVTSTTGPDTAPNSAFTNDPATVGESSLETPPIAILSASANINFRLRYITESTFDGCVLEIKIGAGAYTDIVTAGGTFTANGYNGTISNSFMNPLGGRMAWTGTSAGGYLSVSANLPAAANGQNVQFRWRMGSDNSVGATGVNVDGISLVNGYTCSFAGDRPVADFDGDGKTDLSVFRMGTWYIQRSTAGFIGVGFGLGTDAITPGDYDGDGKADIAVFRTNTWYILKSSDGLVLTVPWGTGGDLPRQADYDGDGKTDVAVYRPGSNTYFVRRSSDLALAAQAWGIAMDIPVVADFDGDNKADYGVFRSGTWHILGSTAGYSATAFGIAGDKLVPADYDGDQKADIAVYRSGTWYLLRSMAGYTSVPFGIGTDNAVPGDYDGDGKDDVTVFRGSTGTWHVLGSTAGYAATPFGAMGDVAVPTGYIP